MAGVRRFVGMALLLCLLLPTLAATAGASEAPEDIVAQIDDYMQVHQLVEALDEGQLWQVQEELWAMDSYGVSVYVFIADGIAPETMGEVLAQWAQRDQPGSEVLGVAIDMYTRSSAFWSSGTEDAGWVDDFFAYARDVSGWMLRGGDVFGSCISLLEAVHDYFGTGYEMPDYGQNPAEYEPAYEGGIPQDASREDALSLLPQGRRLDAFVYDEYDLLDDNAEARLEERAGGLFERYRTNFVVWTTSGNTEDGLKYASERYFYDQLGMGEGDLCVMMTIDMSIRNFRIDTFLYWKPIITDWDCDDITLDMQQPMRDGDYEQAAEVYMEGVAGYMENHMQSLLADAEATALRAHIAELIAAMPEIDPSARIADGAGRLSGAERGGLIGGMEALEAAEGFRFHVALAEVNTPETFDPYFEAYVDRYFANGGAGDTALLLIDTAAQRAGIMLGGVAGRADEQFGMSGERLDEAVMQEYLSYSVAETVGYFIDTVGEGVHDMRVLDSFDEIDVDPSVGVYDFADALTDEQEAALRDAVARFRKRHKTDVALIAALPEDDWMLDEMTSAIVRGNLFSYDMVVLAVYAEPGGMVGITRRNGRPADKIFPSDEWDTQRRIADFLAADDPYGAFDGFLSDTNRGMNSLIPKYEMVTEAGEMLGAALTFGLVAMAVGLLVLAIVNRRIKTAPPPTGNYVKPGSFFVSFSDDVFVATHTTAVRRPKEDSSSSSSGGSSGGGGSSSSSGSQRSF